MAQTAEAADAYRPRSASWWQSRRSRTLMMQVLAYSAVTAGAVILMIPFVWMLSSSLKAPEQI